MAAVGLFTAGAFLPKLFPGLVNEDVEPGGPGDHSWGGYEDKQRRTTDQAQKGGPGDYSWGGYEDKKSQKIQGLSGGGWIVPGSGSGDSSRPWRRRRGSAAVSVPPGALPGPGFAWPRAALRSTFLACRRSFEGADLVIIQRKHALEP